MQNPRKQWFAGILFLYLLLKCIAMKKAILLLSLCLSLAVTAQDFVISDFVTASGNDELHPCISAAEYAALNRECTINSRRLGSDAKANRNILTTSLLWPIRAAANLNDCGYHFIGAYVDQNTAASALFDYNCETNTYDGHHGTDIAIWPYGFYKMDNSMVEVIAAASGTIVQKADGNFDRNCAANNLTANSIIIQHIDGSNALYWHMKKNSVTTKNVGDSVAAGEYLGIAGSSGSASGPHLHFEVWGGNTNATYQDPFSGSCNLLNANSWWSAQKPHTDPTVLKVSTNTTDILLPGCPNTETPNEADSFTIPFQGAGLAPGYAKFYVFTRDELIGLTGDCKILNPNGSVLNSWTFTSSANNKIYVRGFSKLLPTISGTYTFRATYNGVSCSKNFEIVNPLGLPDLSGLESITINPNPAKDHFTVMGNASGEFTFSLFHLTGQLIAIEQATAASNYLRKSFTIAGLAKGIYLLQIDNAGKRKVIKIIKQ